MQQKMLQHALFHNFERVATRPVTGVGGLLRNAFAMSVIAVPLLIIETETGERTMRSHDIYGYAAWQDPPTESARRAAGAGQGPDFAPGAAITRADDDEENNWWTRLRARFGRPAASAQPQTMNQPAFAMAGPMPGVTRAA